MQNRPLPLARTGLGITKLTLRRLPTILNSEPPGHPMNMDESVCQMLMQFNRLKELVLTIGNVGFDSDEVHRRMSVKSRGDVDRVVDLLVQGAPHLESLTIGPECKLDITSQHKSDTGLFNLFKFKGRNNFFLFQNLQHLRVAQNILLRKKYEDWYKFPTAAECD
jgi:hypothetical protein